MHRLIITDGTNNVEMPVTRDITHGGTLEGVESVMKSGNRVFDVIGFRKKVTYKYDYVPQKVFDILIPMLRTKKYLTVTYLDLDNNEKTALFSIEYPSARTFKLLRGKGAIWHDVTIILDAKEVDRND